MIKALYRRLNHCNDLAVRISKANTAQLQQLKAELAELIGTPTGRYTMGIPAVLSTLGVIVSFGIPQLWLGYKVSAALGQPEESVFIWVVLIALLFSGINGMTMFLIGKGLMRAVQVHLTLAVISLVLTTVYLLTALSVASVPGVSLIAALISIFMLLLSGYCIHSISFYKMLLFTLHNRAWRKLLHQTRKT
ncbi:hypothetical protein ACETTA_00730 [Enterobacter cloacae]|uniref:hypothetical protein n=1 Tax=Enterobacter cloacae TaxID=550 RepID=UPI0035A59D80